MLENNVFDFIMFCYFPGLVAEAIWWVGCGGWVVVGGWLAGGIENKANSVQLILQLPTRTELGNILKYSQSKTV